ISPLKRDRAHPAPKPDRSFARQTCDIVSSAAAKPPRIGVCLPARPFAASQRMWVRFGVPILALALLTTGCGSGSRGSAHDQGTGGWGDGGVRFPVEGQASQVPSATSAGLLPTPRATGSLFNELAPLTKIISSRGPGYKLPSLCRSDGTIDTGPLIHPAWAPPCVAPFSGSNGGATARGVTGDTIHLAYYLTEDP